MCLSTIIFIDIVHIPIYRANQALVLAKFLHRRNEADPILLKELENADQIMGLSSPLSLSVLETIVETRLEWARDDAHRWLAEARQMSRNLYARLGYTEERYSTLLFVFCLYIIFCILFVLFYVYPYSLSLNICTPFSLFMLGNGRGAKHPSTLTALSMLADITAMPNTKRAIGSAVRLYRRCIGLRKRGKHFITSICI